MKTYFSDLINFITELNSLGIYFEIIDDNLKINAPKGTMNNSILNEIKLKKKEILSFIKTSNQSNPHKKIPCCENKEYYDLSPAQKRMFLFQQINAESTVYNSTLLLQIPNSIDVSLINEYFKRLIYYHESLRTRFEIINEEPVQIIQSNFSFKLEELHISKSDLKDYRTKFVKPFDLNKAPLFRAVLLYVDQREIYLLIDTHHIVGDGFSNNILEKDFESLLRGEKLKPLRLQYRDYSEWIIRLDVDESDESYSKYWNSVYNDGVPSLNLPIDFIRPQIQTFDGASINFTLSKEQTELLKGLSSKYDATLYIILYVSFLIFIHKLSDQKRIAIGTPVANRSHSDTEKIVGLFINILALNNEIKTRETFNQLVARLKDSVLSAFENQGYPFEKLMESVVETRDVSRNPLFDIMFSLLNQTEYKADLSSISDNKNEHRKGIAKYDLTLLAVDCGEQLLFEFEYNTRLFKKETIDKYIIWYKNVVNQILTNQEIKISDIEIITNSEKKDILFKYNNTVSNYPRNYTIQKLFEEQVAKTPDNIAIYSDGKEITYKALNEKSNQLASYLISKTGQNNIIAVTCSRSIEMVISILGILKSGNAYLPIDLKYPKDRNIQILSLSNTRIIVSDQQEPEFENFESVYIHTEEILNSSKHGVNIDYNSNDLAYVIYTSGSTGIPKGVMISHRNVVNFIHGMYKVIPMATDECLLSLTTIAFDIFGLELFVPITLGASVILINNDDLMDLQELDTLYKGKNISTVQLTPSRLSMMIAIPELRKFIRNIKTLLIGGEQLPESLLNNVREIAENCKIYNIYGPTETTIWSTFKDLSHNSEINIGKPIDNTYVYILNNEKNLQPVGIPGELYISGDGVARGYLNNVSFTYDRFIKDPFRENEKMYQTGDLARWLPNGDIEFIGRADFQVKIKGHRIELGEIENALLKYDNIHEGIVTVKSEKENKFLCAYIVLLKKEQNVSANLRVFLSKIIPDYMIPSYFVVLDKMPTTPNGKVNRKALPEPIVEVEEIRKPQNWKEEIIAKVWSEVLNVKEVGTNHNYFEIGGDSIKAVQIVARLQKYGLKLLVKDLFNYQTIKEIQSHAESVENDVIQKKLEGRLSVIPNKLEYLKPGELFKAYNLHSTIIYSNERLNKEKLNKVFKELIKRHDLLRGYLVNRKNETFIEIQNLNDFQPSINYFEVLDGKNTESTVNKVKKEISASFKYESALIKLALIKSSKNDILLIVVHKLIFDIESWKILLSDFRKIYKAIILDNKPEFDLRNNSIFKLEERLKSPNESEKNYWEDIHNSLLKYEMPNGLQVKKETLNGNKEKIIGEVSFKQLVKANKAYNTKAKDLIITAFGLAITEWLKAKNIFFNVVSNERSSELEELNLNNTIGNFNVEFPFLYETTDANLSMSIKQTKENLRRIPKGYYDFDFYKRKISDKTDFIDEKYKQINLVYLGDVERETCKNSIYEINDSIFDIFNCNDTSEKGIIYIYSMIINNTLQFEINYDLQYFNSDLIIELRNLLQNKLQVIFKHCLNVDDIEKTPSDFDYNKLSFDSLNKINNYITECLDSTSKVKYIYPLSPMQKGMLFHSLLEKESDVYLQQLTFYIEGELDIDILEQSFNRVINKYDIFRTLFIHSELDEPLQVVVDQRSVKVKTFDYCGVNEEKQKKIIDDFRIEELKNGFNISKDILFRINVLQFDKNKYCIIWSYHHILMDGWDTTIIYRNILRNYKLIKLNRFTEEIDQYPYRNYIKWLMKQNEEETFKFWEKYLNNYKGINIISLLKTEKSNSVSGVVDKQRLVYNEDLTNQIRNIAAKNAVTINTILQTLWGILLQKYSNENDIVFGTVVSGRPPELEGVEEMIGLFINTIPVRIKAADSDSFSELLQKTQKLSIETKEFEYLSLAEIQAKVSTNNIVDHVLVFENYPIHTEMERLSNDKSLGFSINSMESIEKTNYSFVIGMLAEKEILFEIRYDKNVYSEDLIKLILVHYNELITQIVKYPDIKISDLKIGQEEEYKKTSNSENLDRIAKINRQNLIPNSFIEYSSLLKEAENEGKQDYVSILVSSFIVLIQRYIGVNEIPLYVSKTLKAVSDLENIIGKLLDVSVDQFNLHKLQTINELVGCIKNEANIQELKNDTFIKKGIGSKNKFNKLCVDNVFAVRIIDQRKKTNLIKHSKKQMIKQELSLQEIDLMLGISINDNDIDVFFDYSNELFDSNFIEKIVVNYNSILKQIQNNSNINLSEIEVESSLRHINSKIVSDIKDDFTF